MCVCSTARAPRTETAFLTWQVNQTRCLLADARAAREEREGEGVRLDWADAKTGRVAYDVSKVPGARSPPRDPEPEGRDGTG